MVPVLIGVAGAWVGMVVGGHQTTVLGPFRVQLSANFGHGDTVIELPPFGTLSADTHAAPLHITATLENVGIDQLSGAIQQDGVATLVSRTQREALNAVEPFAIRLFIVAMCGAIVLSLVAFRRRWRSVLIALLAAFVAVGGTELAAYATFQPSAFAQPTFTGSLVLAHQLIGPVEIATGRLQDFTDELSRIIAGSAQVYASIQVLPGNPEQEIRVLHISDIHLSPLGMKFAQELARSFDADFVLDTGDITSFGTPAENFILSYIPGFHIPYVFVRGNHDSADLQRAVGHIKNARVLDGQTATIDGIAIYGLGDPVFTPNKLTVGDDRQIADEVASAGLRIKGDLAGRATAPDIVAVHDDRMTAGLAGEVPLVLSGHFHVTESRNVRGTLFLRVGSTGGAGANVFTQEGGIPLSAQILYFVPGSPPMLVAYDDIQQSPETGSLTVTRHLVDEGAGKLTLTPSAPPSGNPPGSSPATTSPGG